MEQAPDPSGDQAPREDEEGLETEWVPDGTHTGSLPNRVPSSVKRLAVDEEASEKSTPEVKSVAEDEVKTLGSDPSNTPEPDQPQKIGLKGVWAAKKDSGDGADGDKVKSTGKSPFASLGAPKAKPSPFASLGGGGGDGTEDSKGGAVLDWSAVLKEAGFTKTQPNGALEAQRKIAEKIRRRRQAIQKARRKADHSGASHHDREHARAKWGARKSSLGGTGMASALGIDGSEEGNGSFVAAEAPKWPSPQKYNSNSLYLFTLESRVRQFTISCIEWPWWDRTVLFIILLNTIQLAMYDPYDIPESRPVSPRRDVLEYISTVFSAIFVVECIVKVIALGLIIGPHTYLSEPWNWLDFFIVIIGILDFLPVNAANLSALRSLRVMRPLRAINRFPQLKFLVNLLLQCLPLLSNVLALCCFIFFVFGILGVQLVAGRLRGRCYDIEIGLILEAEGPCSTRIGMEVCPSGYECLLLAGNPGRGMINFDSIGGAIVTIFQVMTLEGWTDVMYFVQDAYWEGAYIYFVVLVFIGPIFAIQLFLVVITSKFADVKEALKKMDAAALASPPASPRGRSVPTTSGYGKDLQEKLHNAVHQGAFNELPPQEKMHEVKEHISSDDAVTPIDNSNNSNGLGQCHDHSNGKATEDTSLNSNGTVTSKTFTLDRPPEGAQDPSKMSPVKENGPPAKPHVGNVEDFSVSTLRMKLKVREGTRGEDDMDNEWEALDDDFKQDADPVIENEGIRAKIRRLAKSTWMSNAVLVVISVNTGTMAIDMHCDFCVQTWCPTYKASLEVTNLFFASVFILEAAIKIVGLGPKLYLQSKANIFDAIIVAISILEMPAVVDTYNCYMSDLPCDDYVTACDSGGSGLSVLRTFRLLRVVKLLRAFPDVQKQIKILVSVLGSVAALNTLIFIFLLIFCILGMSLFGGVLRAEWDPELVELGATVFVKLPWEIDTTDRVGRVIQMDHDNHTLTPWLVEIRYGQEDSVQEMLQLPEKGQIWVSVEGSQGLGEPFITGVSPRMNFDDLPHAAVATFEVLTINNWNEQLYNAVDSQGSLAGMYYYTLIVIGNWMLLNLFIAILIQGFAEQKMKKFKANMHRLRNTMVDQLFEASGEDFGEKIASMFDSFDLDESQQIDVYELNERLGDWNVTLAPKELKEVLKRYDINKSGTLDFEEFLAMLLDFMKQAKIDESAFDQTRLKKTKKDARTMWRQKTAMRLSQNGGKAFGKSVKTKTPPPQKSCYICLPDSALRRACSKLMVAKPFDRFILFSIFVSCVGLGLDRPEIGSNSPERTALTATEISLNGIFAFEATVKIIAMTFKVYIKSGWNQVDLLIVTTSLLDMILTYSLFPDLYSFKGQNMALGALKIFRIFRIFRALRPLRVIARAKGLRVLVTTLMSAVRPVLNTAGIAFCIFGVCGVFGMQILSGKLYRCNDPKKWSYNDCTGVTEDGETREWLNYEVNFDNFLASLVSMFILSTQDDWTAHMLAGVDATGKRTGPEQNAHLELMLFYVACIIVGGFLVINIFVGVFVDCYTAASTDAGIEKREKLQPKDLPDVYDDPNDPLRRRIADVVNGGNFDLFIAFFIITNVISMAMESYKQSDWQIEFLEATNFAFTFVFGFECFFKMYALHPRRYFSAKWNRFDFFIVMLSYIGILIDNLGNTVGVNPTVLRILRIFRVFRLLRAFRIFKAAKGLHSIIITLVASLPAILNLFAMLGLLFFVYGVLGVTLYGTICVDGEQQLEGMKAVRCMATKEIDLLDSHANFLSVFYGVLTLFRVATGDAWGDILASCSLAPGSRKVTDEAWEDYKRLVGFDPAGLDSSNSLFLEQDSSGAALKIASVAIQSWNRTTFGYEKDPDWPMPTKLPLARQWVFLLRAVMPGCLSDDEVYNLEADGLLDCSVGQYDRACSSSCGDALFANLYFMTFVCMAAFVLLQLVIAVLMEQLEQTTGSDDSVKVAEFVPGCNVLQKQIFQRLYRRWRHKAGIRDSSFRFSFSKKMDSLRASSVHSKKKGSKSPVKNGSPVRGSSPSRPGANKVAPGDDIFAAARRQASDGGIELDPPFECKAESPGIHGANGNGNGNGNGHASNGNGNGLNGRAYLGAPDPLANVTRISSGRPESDLLVTEITNES